WQRLRRGVRRRLRRGLFPSALLELPARLRERIPLAHPQGHRRREPVPGRRRGQGANEVAGAPRAPIREEGRDGRSHPAAGAAVKLAPLLAVLLPFGASQEPPWPGPVAGWTAPAPGEHPRLFFRKSGLPRLRERAKTPEGLALLKRLRFLLDGGSGESM